MKKVFLFLSAFCFIVATCLGGVFLFTPEDKVTEGKEGGFYNGNESLSSRYDGAYSNYTASLDSTWAERFQDYEGGSSEEVSTAGGLAAWFWGQPGATDTIELTQDIDMSEYLWTTIPDFYMNIHGNGYSITGVKIIWDLGYLWEQCNEDVDQISRWMDRYFFYGSDAYFANGIGMFGNFYGEITNLKVGVTIIISCSNEEVLNACGIECSEVSYGGYIGALAAHNNGTIENVTASTFIVCNDNVTSDDKYVGGVFGEGSTSGVLYSDGRIISDSSLEDMSSNYWGDVSIENAYVGGLVGTTDVITGAFSVVAIEWNTSAAIDCRIGGLAGRADQVQNSYYLFNAVTRVTGEIGGIAGEVSEILNCFSIPFESSSIENINENYGQGHAISPNVSNMTLCAWYDNANYTWDGSGSINDDGSGNIIFNLTVFRDMHQYDEVCIGESSRYALDVYEAIQFDTSYWAGYWVNAYGGRYPSQSQVSVDGPSEPAPPASYTVTFNGNGGTTSSGETSVSITVVEGGTATCPESFIKEGYVFDGWSGSTSNIQSNITVYAVWVTAYTITYIGNGGTTSSGASSITQTVGAGKRFLTKSNTAFTKSGYKLVNWSTSSSYVGGGYTGTTTYYTFSENANITLYAIWQVDRDFTVSVRIYIDANGTGVYTNPASSVIKTIVDSYTVSYYYDNNGTATPVTKTVENSSLMYAESIKGMINRQFTFTFTAKSGYKFYSYKRSSISTFSTINSSSSLYPTSSLSSPFSFTPSSLTDDKYLYVYFRKDSSNNKLKFDSSENYYYFEDGYFPQSYVGDSLNSTLNSASSGSLSLYQNLQYLDGSGVIQTIPIYTYSGNKYAKVTKNGTTKWFKMEAIRWRVSDYGASNTTYPTAWKSVTSRSNFKVVSDRVLWFGAVTTTNTKEGWSFDSSEMATTFANIYVKNGEALTSEKPVYASTYGEKSYYFGEVGQQIKVKYTTKSMSGINIATQEEIEEALTDLKAKASDMVAFVMGLNDDSYCDYWTRELGVSLKNGKMITSSGMYASEWLQNFNGVRFSLRMSEGSKV